MKPKVPDDKGYWFPATRYGWGWGPPRRWQGWVVIVAFLAVIGGWVAVVASNPGRFGPLTPAFALLAGGLLVVICWWKGERPRWRWGD